MQNPYIIMFFFKCPFLEMCDYKVINSLSITEETQTF